VLPSFHEVYLTCPVWVQDSYQLKDVSRLRELIELETTVGRYQ